MTSYFDNIPNEVLEHIVSLVPWYENVKFTEEGKEHVLCQVVVLLQVSRRFRRATQNSPIWHEFLFEFEGLVPDTFMDDDHPLPANGFHRVNGLCHALFADSYFVACLQSKCDWSFSSLECLLAVQLHVPSFSKSARTVLLSLKGTDVAIHRLSTCQNLTKLHIHAGSDASLDLSSIALFAPRLKALFIDCPRMVFGSLSEIKGLEELALQCVGGELNFGDLDEDEILVPIASQNTLTRLTLDDVEDFCLIDQFPDLKHLKTALSPVGDELAAILENSVAKLESLDTQFIFQCPVRDPTCQIREQLPLLSCLCLSHLTTIHLSLLCTTFAPFVEDYVDASMLVLAEMTSQLVHLEEVELFAGVDLDRVHYLNRLKNLKTLDWSVPTGFNQGNDEEALNNHVRQLFEDVINKPDILIRVENRRLRDGIFVFTEEEIQALLRRMDFD